MDEQLELRLKRILYRPKSRPLVRCPNRNGKKCWCRKTSLSYFQYLEAHPKPFMHQFLEFFKFRPLQMRKFLGM